MQLLRNAVVGFCLAEEGEAHAGLVKSAQSVTGLDAAHTEEVLAAVVYYVQRG